ncbi:MAG: T9SS type A sorting domain-containing protein [Melioribacteraceae bacterium]|nr:T9SS type A sorting domain-containing protein [Melioribacteraceae bacterium]
MIPPFGEDIWSDDGHGIPVPVEDDVWSWVDLSVIDFPEFTRGEVFAVVVKNTTEYNEEDYSTSNWGCFADEEAPATGLKFYAGGRLSEEDYGWWIRPGYTWDFRVAVDISEGPWPPYITNVTQIQTTLSTEPQQVSATVTSDSGPDSDNAISSVILFYSIDDGNNWIEIEMTGIGDIYSASIPGQNPGTSILYYVWAEDIFGNESTNGFEYNYFIFAPESDNILVFNGFDAASGYPQDYYFGKDDFANYQPADWDHDVWAYGELTPELLSYYDNVIEIATYGPNDINSDSIRSWLEADPNHNYMLAGDEWLGAQTDWEDSVYQPGDFQYDILGISADHNDLVSSSQNSSYIIAVEGSTLGDALFGKQQEIEGADSLFYNPNYEITAPNWIDGVDFLPGVDVFMQTVFEDSLYDVAGSRELDAGNKIVFFAYDPLSINSLPEYYWFGFSASAPQVEALRWFGIDVVTTTKIETEEIVNQFSLSQNYPNPFNPTTTIEYIIPNSVGDENFRPLRMVKLKVFDVLGREIKTLINKPMQPGKYKVEFDASELSSGVYFYTLSSGEFIQTKKFLLLK